MGKKKAIRRSGGEVRPKGSPGHLSAEAAGLWEKLRIEWRVRDEAGLLMLTTAFEAFDRMRSAQAAIAQFGIMTPDRFEQLKPNPACVVERDSRAAFLSAIRQLGIEPDDEL